MCSLDYLCCSLFVVSDQAAGSGFQQYWDDIGAHEVLSSFLMTKYQAA